MPLDIGLPFCLRTSGVVASTSGTGTVTRGPSEQRESESWCDGVLLVADTQIVQFADRCAGGPRGWAVRHTRPNGVCKRSFVCGNS